MRKYLINILLFLLLAGGYGLAASALNGLAGEEAGKEDRLEVAKRDGLADVQSGSWTSAARNYKKLIDDDPLNGGAHLYYTHCIENELMAMIKQLRSFDSTDEAVVAETKSRVDEKMEQVVEAYEALLEFKRYRNRARFRLSLLHGYSGRVKLAKQFFADALNDGFVPNDRASFNASVRFYDCIDIITR